MEKIAIRLAEKTDMNVWSKLKQQIHSIHVDGAPKQFYKMSSDETIAQFQYFMDKDNFEIYMAQLENGIIAGYVVIMYSDNKAFSGAKMRKIIVVDEICVDEKCRHKGIGRALMQKIVDIAEEKDFDAVELSVWSFNTEAKDFYEKMGMQRKVIHYRLEI